MLNRSVPLVVTGVLLLAACGGSEDTVDSTTTTPPTTIDLTIGLFTPNESVTTTTEPTDGTADTTGVTTTVATTVVEDTGLDDADPPVIDDGTGDQGSTDSMQGLITIGGVDYPFGAESCQVSPELVDVRGIGVASDGSEFEAAISFSSDDFDADGTPDTTLEIVVTGIDGPESPNFYGVAYGSSGGVSDEAITVLVQAPRISGSGPIEDLNGIAFGGEPTPMTFEATCP